MLILDSVIQLQLKDSFRDVFILYGFPNGNNFEVFSNADLVIGGKILPTSLYKHSPFIKRTAAGNLENAFDLWQRVHAFADDYFYRRARIIGSINKCDLVGTRRISPLGVQGDVCIDIHRAACCVPRAARAVNRPSVKHHSLGSSKAAIRKQIIGVDIGNRLHCTRAAVCVEGYIVTEFVERNRADKSGIQVVMREGNAIGASVDGNGYIFRVGKGIAFLGIDVNAYRVRLTGLYSVVYITEHISILAPVLEPLNRCDLIIR